MNNIIENNIEDNVKKKTLSIFLNKNVHNSIFKFLSKISKNIYNTTIYISSIYYKYKEEIFFEANNNYLNDKLSEEQFYEKIYANFQYFYNLYSKEDSLIKINNNILYKKIIEKIKNINLNNDNYKIIRNEIIFENLGSVKFTNKYEYEFIIDSILISIYRKKYYLTEYQIKNKIPVKFIDFVDIVKKRKNLFPYNKSIKENIIIGNFNELFLENNNKNDKDEIIVKTKLLSDENIITRFIYKNLGENYDKIPSDLICNIIKKTFGNFKSYWSSNTKSLNCSKSKFLDKDELFILPFFMRSFKINKSNCNVRLTVGKYVAQNYIEITKNDNLICLNLTEDTHYKKYIDKKYLKINLNGAKLSKNNNFIIDNMYIEKNNVNIIDAYYLNLKLPEKIIGENIKLIEINSLYKGYKFKLNITYDLKGEILDIQKNKLNFKDINAPLNLNPNDAISIDFGMKNLMTIYDPSGIQTIIKGNYLLSLNHYYNNKLDLIKSEMTKDENKDKKEEFLKLKYNLEIKRQNKINDYFNKIVKYLYNLYEDSKKIIIAGYNLNWKNNLNLGKHNNRKFYGIPYRKLVKKLQEKFNDKFILTEEAYTSKCDALSLEEIKHQENFSGKRIERGLFQSQKGLINADLNGAINIMRKKINLTKITGFCLNNPIVVNVITPKILNISRDVIKIENLIKTNQRVKSKMVAQ
jgi:IS605 OrfB family transposase